MATGNVLQYCRGIPFYDLLTCVRTGTTVEHVHPERPKWTKLSETSVEMAKIFLLPTALANTAVLQRLPARP